MDEAPEPDTARAVSVANTIGVGDCVELSCGGPRMVVERVRTDGVAECVWFDGAEVSRDAFPVSALIVKTRLFVVGASGSGRAS